jgi:ketosteroid isomerase-like protein
MTDWSTYQKGSMALDVETAQKWLDQVTAACNSLDTKRIVDCLTDDAVADLGEIVLVGKEQLRPFIRDRYSQYTYFDLKKILRAVSGDLVIVDARLRWRSAEQKGLQHTRALEILQVRDGRIARWDNASVSWADPGGKQTE